jgi:hypothetical protein
MLATGGASLGNNRSCIGDCIEHLSKALAPGSILAENLTGFLLPGYNLGFAFGAYSKRLLLFLYFCHL